MKIISTRNSWTKYAKALNEFVNPKFGTRASEIVGYKKLRPINQFLSWPSMPKRQISAQSGFSLAPSLDLQPIEHFLKRHESLARTEPLLRTSPLLSPAIDDIPMTVLEKAVAIKRMASLMHETLLSMKNVSQIQSSYHRG